MGSRPFQPREKAPVPRRPFSWIFCFFIAPGARMGIYVPGSSAVLFAIFSLIAETVSVIGRVVVSITFAS